MDHTTAHEYLTTFGYLDAKADVESTDAPGATIDSATSDPAFAESLIDFQRFFGLAATGELDDATVAAMETPRCGVGDHQSFLMAAGDAWPKRLLTFALENLTERIPRKVHVGNALQFAFEVWGAATGLRFEKVALDENPDIVIRFATGAHGDGSAFDGPRGTLAHAFFPPPNGGGTLAGDIHFDDDENWTVDVPLDQGEFDLVTLALHEAGHSLGLTHSSDPNDIMFPTVDRLQRTLGAGDVTRIAALYGSGSDGAGTPIGHGGPVYALHTGDDQVDLVTVGLTGGRRHRRRTAAGWGEWVELGGEYDPYCTVNPWAVQTADKGRVIMFARSFQKHVIAQVIDPGPGAILNLGGRRASSLFVAGLAGLPTVFLTANRMGIDDPLTGHQGPTGRFLLEQSYDGVTAGGWQLAFEGVGTLPAVATKPDGTAALVVSDTSGAVSVLEGSVGSWGDPDAAPSHAPLDPKNSFWPMAACWSDPDTLDIAIVTAERELLVTRRRGSSWSDWISFGSTWASSCQLASDGAGNVALAARRQFGPSVVMTNNGTGWEPVAGLPDDHLVVAASGQPGRLDFFAMRPRRRLVHHSQTW